MKYAVLLLGALFLNQEAKADLKGAWGGTSFPSTMVPRYNDKLDKLPLSGHAAGEKKFWSGDYWAFYKGSINQRWNAPGTPGFNLKSPTREEASKMSIEELSELAPTEKYDLFTGRYDYPLKKEVAEKADPYAAEWEGICHGWAPAALNHNEPTAKVLVNPDGIAIPFGSSDIKALLSYYYAYEFKVSNTHQMGRRCSQNGIFIFSKNCKQDLNAGSFHIVLANKIGLQKEGFLADLDRYKEVWNHPVISYESEIISERRGGGWGAARGTKKIVRVETTLNYIDESVNDWQVLLGTDEQKVEQKIFSYDLEIGAYGNIIGGVWKTQDRPDFLWTKEKAVIWVGQFDRLNELLND